MIFTCVSRNERVASSGGYQIYLSRARLDEYREIITSRMEQRKLTNEDSTRSIAHLKHGLYTNSAGGVLGRTERPVAG